MPDNESMQAPLMQASAPPPPPYNPEAFNESEWENSWGRFGQFGNYYRSHNPERITAKLLSFAKRSEELNLKANIYHLIAIAAISLTSVQQYGLQRLGVESTILSRTRYANFALLGLYGGYNLYRIGQLAVEAANIRDKRNLAYVYGWTVTRARLISNSAYAIFRNIFRVGGIVTFLYGSHLIVDPSSYNNGLLCTVMGASGLVFSEYLGSLKHQAEAYMMSGFKHVYEIPHLTKRILMAFATAVVAGGLFAWGQSIAAKQLNPNESVKNWEVTAGQYIRIPAAFLLNTACALVYDIFQRAIASFENRVIRQGVEMQYQQQQQDYTLQIRDLNQRSKMERLSISSYIAADQIRQGGTLMVWAGCIALTTHFGVIAAPAAAVVMIFSALQAMESYRNDELRKTDDMARDANSKDQALSDSQLVTLYQPIAQQPIGSDTSVELRQRLDGISQAAHNPA